MRSDALVAGELPREIFVALDRGIRRRLALEDRSTAYRRRKKVRGRGTARGKALARATVRRFFLLSPMFNRPEARA